MPSGDIGDTELRAWLERIKESNKPCGMSVSCPTCWLPILLNGNGAFKDGGCPCGTIATARELKEAFGIGHLKGEFTSPIKVRD